MTKKGKRQEASGGQWIGTMCELLKGGVLAGAAAVLGLLLCAALISAGVLRERWIPGTAPAVCALGALAGGLYTVRRVGRRTLPVGMGVGTVLFLLLLMAGLLAFDTASLEQGGVGILCSCLCGGALAGLFGGFSRKKHRR